MSQKQSTLSDRTSSFICKPDAGKPRILIAGASGQNNEFAMCFPDHSYDLIFSGTGEHLSNLLTTDRYDLILLNSVLSDLDGISAVRLLTSIDKPPYVLVRSETDDEFDRVLALEIGADDCVALSCSVREIKARARAVFRRQFNQLDRTNIAPADRNPYSPSKLSYAGWILYKDRYQIHSPSGGVIPLSSSEYLILLSLFSDPGAIKDRASLKGITGNINLGEVRAITVFVSRLRKKMAKYGGENLIKTIRGKGYRL